MAREAAEKLIQLDPEWISHSLIRYEVGNVGLNYLRHGSWEREDVELQLKQVPGLLLEVVDVIDAEATFKVAAENGLSFYDASYVWLARVRGLKLRTRDKKILRECPDVAVGMA